MVVGCVGTGYVLRVELPVQKRLCPIFVRDVGSPGIHERFHGLTGSQQTPRFWGITAIALEDQEKTNSLALMVYSHLGRCPLDCAMHQTHSSAI